MSAATPVPKSELVAAKVKVVPARRTASYGVSLTKRKADDVTARVNAKGVVLSGGVGSGYGNKSVELPKTLAAVELVQRLLEAVRGELLEQGVTE